MFLFFNVLLFCLTQYFFNSLFLFLFLPCSTQHYDVILRTQTRLHSNITCRKRFLCRSDFNNSVDSKLGSLACVVGVLSPPRGSRKDLFDLREYSCNSWTYLKDCWIINEKLTAKSCGLWSVYKESLFERCFECETLLANDGWHLLVTRREWAQFGFVHKCILHVIFLLCLGVLPNCK